MSEKSQPQLVQLPTPDEMAEVAYQALTPENIQKDTYQLLHRNGVLATHGAGIADQTKWDAYMRGEFPSQQPSAGEQRRGGEARHLTPRVGSFAVKAVTRFR